MKKRNPVKPILEQERDKQVGIIKYLEKNKELKKVVAKKKLIKKHISKDEEE